MEKEFDLNDLIHDLLAASVVQTARINLLQAAFLNYVRDHDPEQYHALKKVMDQLLQDAVQTELLKHPQFSVLLQASVQELLKSVDGISLP